VAVCLIAQKSLSHNSPEINNINEWQMLWYIMNGIYTVNLHCIEFQVFLTQQISNMNWIENLIWEIRKKISIKLKIIDIHVT
jgi:hypothetical protein